MASQQPTIREFLAKSCQARPHSNIASVVLIDDSSEESDDEWCKSGRGHVFRIDFR